MASRKTWIGVILALLGLGVVSLLGVAGAGAYFLAHHVDAQDSNGAEAIRAFDEVRTAFKSAGPLFEVDASDQPRAVQPLSALPSSEVQPESLCILGWDPDRERLIRMDLPLWLVRLSKHKMRFARDNHAFDVSRLNLDITELQRVGPALLVDVRADDGGRLLLWTQ